MIAVDFFCGAGGFGTGAAIAGIEVRAAVNHNVRSVESYTRNHPGTRVYCENLHHFDHGKLPRFDLLLASPSCQGMSDARGTDKPRHDVARMTPGVVVDVAEICRPARIVVENVTEMVRKWVRFPAWRADLEALGYDVSINILNAKDFGVPQDRERVIIVAFHKSTGRKAPVLRAPMLPERHAIEVIDFTKGTWFPTAKYVEATQVRIADGRRRGWTRFVAPYYGSGSGECARSIHRPIGTITTLDRWLVVDGDRGRVLTDREDAAFQSFPEGYYFAGTRRERIMQIGNAIPPLMAAEVLKQVVEAGGAS